MLKEINLESSIRYFYIVPGTPFLYIDKLRALVFADAHLGFEEALARGLDYYTGRKSGKTYYMGGIVVPKRQFRKLVMFLEEAFHLLDGKINTVLINGDLKHAFDRLLRQERREVRDLLDYILGKGVREVILVRGNHDNFLPIVLKDYGLELHRSYVVSINDKRVLFTHGHLDIDITDYDVVIIGHEHPVLRCLGMHRFPIFLHGRTEVGNWIIVLPASGAYQPGTIPSVNRENYLSPVIHKYVDPGRLGITGWITVESKMDMVEGGEELLDIGFFEKISVDGKDVYFFEFESVEEALAVCSL